MKSPIIIAIITLVIGAAAGFFGGLMYQKAQTPTFSGRGNGQFARLGGANGATRSGGQAISGDIISSDANSVTVRLNNGSSKIALIGSSTTISKSTTGTIADLTAGTRVVVFGTPNPDGSVTATNIQVNPKFGGNHLPVTPTPAQ